MSNTSRRQRRAQARKLAKEFVQAAIAEQHGAAEGMEARFGAGGLEPEQGGAAECSRVRTSEVPQMVGVSDDVVLARLAKTADIARLLAVHPKTVERLRRSEKLPCIKFGGSVRYDISDVLRWASARKEGV
jgi:excisionase family DNA binding protein